MKSIRDADLHNKKVLLRVDFNVPMEDKKILDDNRIHRSIDTIEYLIGKKAKIIIMTHLGRPDGQVIPTLSTIPLAQKLAEILKHKVFATDHVIDPKVTEIIKEMKAGDILVLGNLRWHYEEEGDVDAFAKDLASYGEIYVNDAFGTSHNRHASLYSITKYLPSYAGFLLESEVTTLKLLLERPKRPFVVVIGGAKMKGKIELIEKIAEKADKILIGGAIANTFAAAKGVDVSNSLVEKDMYEKCERLIYQYSDKIALPEDQIKEDLPGGGFSFMDIGPKTIDRYKMEISNASTIFWNGNMGHSEDKRFENGTKEIAQAIAYNTNTTVIAGGDTVGFVKKNKLDENINFISTGGGATLQFLAQGTLPAIHALEWAKHL